MYNPWNDHGCGWHGSLDDYVPNTKQVAFHFHDYSRECIPCTAICRVCPVSVKKWSLVFNMALTVPVVRWDPIHSYKWLDLETSDPPSFSISCSLDRRDLGEARLCSERESLEAHRVCSSTWCPSPVRWQPPGLSADGKGRSVSDHCEKMWNEKGDTGVCLAVPQLRVCLSLVFYCIQSGKDELTNNITSWRAVIKRIPCLNTCIYPSGQEYARIVLCSCPLECLFLDGEGLLLHH